MRALIDLTGQRFGRLAVIQRSYVAKVGAHWLCRCDCGTDKIIYGPSLRAGKTRSCGCLQAEAAKKYMTAHGHAASYKKTPTYISWAEMITRCENPKKKNFKYYGARGISVCERWRHSFQNFLADMGPRPEGQTLDRWPNRTGNYEPGNCRWATWKEQHND